ncbi:peroxiredoxin [Marivivens marinus]|uniref:peroxiredoxin n=1 Tax=Marivivens marinus TaxID=3110173 RepID=UPI003B848916
MTITTGQNLPDATLAQMGDNGPEPVDLSAKLKGRKVIIFGLPGAFTRTCSAAHLPSFMRTKPEFDKKGVDEIICVAVNDAFVMKAWSDQTGAGEAGVTLLADPDSSFTKAIGMEFSVPAIGFFDRSQRYAMLVEDGVVTHVQQDAPGECNISTGESFLDAI